MSKLAYWNTRGLAQPIRCLLVYTGEDFEDIQYEVTDAPEFSLKDWTDEKAQMADVLDFPNIPYYMDDDVRITQSNAILRHLGRKHNLYGADMKEMATVDMLLEVAMDLRNGIIQLCYNNNYEHLKEDYFKNIQNSLALYEKKLKDNEWFAGKNITVADFPFYELLTQLQMMKPGCLEDYPGIKAFLQRFENLPKVKDYIAREDVKTRPVNNKMAAFIR